MARGVSSASVALTLLAGHLSCRSEPTPRPAAPTCRAEVVMPRGSSQATAVGRQGEALATVRRRALKAACTKACTDEPHRGCVARCLVDQQAQKIGARVTCDGSADRDTPAATR